MQTKTERLQSITPGTTRVNVSMPIALREAAGAVCGSQGHLGLSSYLQMYLRRDAVKLGLLSSDLNSDS